MSSPGSSLGFVGDSAVGGSQNKPPQPSLPAFMESSWFVLRECFSDHVGYMFRIVSQGKASLLIQP